MYMNSINNLTVIYKNEKTFALDFLISFRIFYFILMSVDDCSLTLNLRIKPMIRYICSSKIRFRYLFSIVFIFLKDIVVKILGRIILLIFCLL